MENDFDVKAAREQIAYRVRKEREAQNLTQVALAEIAGVTSQAINHIEKRAAFSLDLLLKVADALYVPVSYLLGEDDTKSAFYEEKIKDLERKLAIWEQSHEELESAYKRIEELEAENKRLSSYEWVVRRVKAALSL